MSGELLGRVERRLFVTLLLIAVLLVARRGVVLLSFVAQVRLVRLFLRPRCRPTVLCPRLFGPSSLRRLGLLGRLRLTLQGLAVTKARLELGRPAFVVYAAGTGLVLVTAGELLSSSAGFSPPSRGLSLP